MTLHASAMSKLGALAVLACFLGLVWQLAWVPLLESTAEADQEVERYGMLRHRLTEELAAHAVAAAGRASLESYKGDFLATDSEAIVIADLQKQLGSLIAANGAELLTAQAIPSRSRGNAKSLGVRIQLRGSIDRIQRIVHTVETSRPLLFVERAILRADPTVTSSATLAGLAAVRLSVELDVVGVQWADTAVPDGSRR